MKMIPKEVQDELFCIRDMKIKEINTIYSDEQVEVYDICVTQ